MTTQTVEQKLADVLAAHAEWVESDCEAGIRLDLTGADLRGTILAGANLTSAELTGTNLTDAFWIGDAGPSGLVLAA